MDKKTITLKPIVLTPDELRDKVEKAAVIPLKAELEIFWEAFKDTDPFKALSISEATFEKAAADTESKLFKAFKKFLDGNDYFLLYYFEYKSLVDTGRYEDFMYRFHALVKNDEFPDFDDNKEVKRTLIKLHDEHWDSEKEMPKVCHGPLSSGTKKPRHKVLQMVKPDKVHVPSYLLGDLVTDIMKFAVVPLTNGIKNEQWRQFIGSKDFEKFVVDELTMKNSKFLSSLSTKTKTECDVFTKKFSDEKKKVKPFLSFLFGTNEYADALLAIAVDEKSDLFNVFKKFCKESWSEDQLLSLVKFNNLCKKDNYHAFMLNFHELIVKKVHADLSSDQKDGLEDMHKKYWDVKRGEPMDVSEMKPKKEVEEPKALITSDSKPDPAKEKVKGEKAKKKEGGGGQSDADLSHEGGSRKRGDRKTIQPGEGKPPKDIGSNSDKGKKEAKEKKEKGGGKS